MEFGRTATIVKLKEMGFEIDELCKRLQRGDFDKSGNTYMVNPDGRYVRVFGDGVTALEGDMRIWDGPLSHSRSEERRLELTADEPYRDITFKAGERVMRHWSYRICEHPEGVFSLREVHFRDNRPILMATTDARFTATNEDGESDEEVRGQIVRSLERALLNAKERPIFRPPADWFAENNFPLGAARIDFCPDDESTS